MRTIGRTYRTAASAIEYGILLALIAAGCIIAVAQTGTKISNTYCKSVLTLQTSGSSDPTATSACGSKTPPTWNVSTTLPNGLAGVDYSSVVPAATAVDGLPISYSSLSLTTGAAFDPGSRTLSSGMPAAGVYTLVGQAADAGGTVQQSFSFTIASGPTGPYGAICSAENGTCSMIPGTHTVTYYCASNPSGSISRSGVSGSIGCNNGVFTDPAVGCVKTCAYH